MLFGYLIPVDINLLAWWNNILNAGFNFFNGIFISGIDIFKKSFSVFIGNCCFTNFYTEM